ncbi:ROK family protein [Nakamurella lactea]|uniref:ROK family protein n=1 Tax=Nakamurella lactea TaxID=459515 RepID=UPI0004256A43|nr:ROK family protein [Nakamurella lactea]
MSTFTVGIDIGGTSVRAAVIDANGAIVNRAREMTPASAAATEDLLVDLVRHLQATHPISGVGLAVAGFISTDRQRVMFAPHLAWRDAQVPAILSARLDLPVVMDHDVNSAVWAEYHLGAAAGSPVALLIALGTGIGAGLVVDGQIYRGAHGVAPELGHLTVVPGGRSCPCGKRGCWERYCSGTALAATGVDRWREAGREIPDELADSEVTGTVVARTAAEGDPQALAAVDELGHWLGIGMGLAADVLDPEVIVIGGGVSDAAPLYLPRALDTMRQTITGGVHRPHPRIEVARYGDRSAVIGAGLLAQHALVASG